MKHRKGFEPRLPGSRARIHSLPGAQRRLYFQPRCAEHFHGGLSSLCAAAARCSALGPVLCPAWAAGRSTLSMRTCGGELAPRGQPQQWAWKLMGKCSCQPAIWLTCLRVLPYPAREVPAALGPNHPQQ
uniref:Uncharacterized protein n=1 Tax=Molossus molossus TaxID=27622 RepID=A0A7J8ERA2_MOLMO|nr:hypothetical protein HJG59_008738 [Molossus molossus]